LKSGKGGAKVTVEWRTKMLNALERLDGRETQREAVRALASLCERQGESVKTEAQRWDAVQQLFAMDADNIADERLSRYVCKARDVLQRAVAVA